MVYVKDRSLNVVSANRAYCDALGVSQDQLIGTSSERLLGEFGPESARIDREIIESGLPRLGITENCTGPEGLRWLLTDKVPITDEEGVVGLIGTSIDITTQRQEQNDLCIRDRLLDLATDCIIVHDPEGNILYFNETTAASRGYTREDLAHATLRDLEAPDQPQLWQERGRILRRDGHATFEIITSRKDGSWFPLEIRATLVMLDKRPIVVSVARDISERVKSEQRLRQSEEQLRLLTDNVADIFWTTDLNFNTTYVSPSVERVLGFSPEERIRQGLQDMVTPQSAAVVLNALQQELHRESQSDADPARAITLEVEYYHKNGSTVWTENIVKGLRDDAGTLVSIVGVARDITERRRAEEALRESEDKYRQLFEQSIAPISLISPEGRVLESNQAWRELFGYSVEDLQELNVRDQYPDPTGRARFLETIGSKGRLVDEELRLKRKDGTLVDLLRSTSVRRKPNGDIIGFQNVFRDVTELKHTRDELFASREQLRRLALRIQEAREEERTTIAQELHDRFGQELTALKLDLDSLTRSRPPEGDAGLVRIRGIIELIDRMSQELRRVISDMRPGMLDDLGLCAAIEWQAEQFSERTGLACDFILTADDTRLPTSTSTALFRVLQELLSNVARHAGATNVDVSLSSNSDSVCLTVADNGRGITDEELGNSTSLGILGIRERIRACDGTVDFHGEPGTGTTVTVTVPIQPAANGQ